MRSAVVPTVLGLLFLAGCGMKGDLYLPPDRLPPPRPVRATPPKKPVQAPKPVAPEESAATEVETVPDSAQASSPGESVAPPAEASAPPAVESSREAAP